jgi:hypothetical protein
MKIESIMLITKLTDDLELVLTNLSLSLQNYEKHVIAYHNFVAELPFSVFYNGSEGYIDVDKPAGMPVSQFQDLTRRLEIHHRVVDFRAFDIDTEVSKGFSIEREIKKINPQFKSEILSKVNQFKQINQDYIIPGSK